MTDPTLRRTTDPALPTSGFELDLEHAALVITDPQIDFLSPEGVSWPVFGDSIQRERHRRSHRRTVGRREAHGNHRRGVAALLLSDRQAVAVR